MGKEKELEEGLKKLSKAEDAFFLAKVISIDDDKFTLDIDVDDFEIYDVRLKSIIDSEQVSIIVIPEKGSSVMVGRQAKNVFFVIKVNEIKAVKILFKDGLKTVLDKDGIVINDGQFGGLIKVAELVNKINSLENTVNSLITSYKAHTHTAPSGGTGTPLPPVTVGLLNPITKINDLENTKVKH